MEVISLLYHRYILSAFVAFFKLSTPNRESYLNSILMKTSSFWTKIHIDKWIYFTNIPIPVIVGIHRCTIFIFSHNVMWYPVIAGLYYGYLGWWHPYILPSYKFWRRQLQLMSLHQKKNKTISDIMQHTTPTNKRPNRNKNTNQYIVYLKNDQYVAKHSEEHETCTYLLSVLFVHQLIDA